MLRENLDYTTMAHMHDSHNEKAVNELWERAQENTIIRGLKEGKMMGEIVSGEQCEKVFRETPCCLGCSDGRIHEARIGRAGMGIVAGVEKTVTAIKKMFDEGKVKGRLVIKSHDGCGAAKIVCDQLIEKGKLPQNYNSDDLGIKFAKDVTVALQQGGYDVVCEHTSEKEMDALHDEVAIYFDGTQSINIENSDFPRGFIFSNLDFDSTECVTELKALCGIALGDHGFGKRFTKENPFRIIISAKNQEQIQTMRDIAEKAAWGFNERVAIDSLIV